MARVEPFARFAATPARVAAAARAAEGRPVPADEWGPREVVRHLIAVEREVWWVRFGQILTDEEPHWAWVEPGPVVGLEDATLGDVLARFARDRGRTVAILDGFGPADWARTGVHQTFGRLDAVGLLGIVNDHDEEHLRGLATPDES